MGFTDDDWPEPQYAGHGSTLHHRRRVRRMASNRAHSPMTFWHFKRRKKK